MTERRGHEFVRRAPALALVIAIDSKGGRRQKKIKRMFRWGMGGGYGRPFFMAMPQTPKKFPAVTIATGTKSCGAVNALEGMRILATHAPALPMANCSMPDKRRCRFKKYVDRRDDDQGRRSAFGEERVAWYPGGQRRKSKGRRTQD